MAFGRIDRDDALELLKYGELLNLGRGADLMRRALHPEGIVTFVIDRNINYTNVCINKCKFCAFWREEAQEGGYVLGRDELFKKIEETIALGGTQILMQGGINPSLDIEYYLDLLRSIKGRFKINIHGFSPPEVVHIATAAGLSVRDTIIKLRRAGLDSIPGGGAELLSDRVRRRISPNKIRTAEWLDVMREAHRLGMRTTATMMFGIGEKPADIIEHLDRIRTLQDETGGFTAFIPWPFQPGNTAYEGKVETATAAEYLRVLAVSRLYLDNVNNVQASWVTQGLKVAEVALRFGANDLGSTMIEENVVASTGVSNSVTMDEMVAAIHAAGFRAAQRDTLYNMLREFPRKEDG